MARRDFRRYENRPRSFSHRPSCSTRVGGGILSTHSMAGGLWGLVTALRLRIRAMGRSAGPSSFMKFRTGPPKLVVSFVPVASLIVLENTNMKRIGLLVVAVSLSLSLAAFAGEMSASNQAKSQSSPTGGAKGKTRVRGLAQMDPATQQKMVNEQIAQLQKEHQAAVSRAAGDQDTGREGKGDRDRRGTRQADGQARAGVSEEGRAVGSSS